MVRMVDCAMQEKENAKAYKELSEIIKEEIKDTKLKVFEYHPPDLPIFYFFKNFLGNLLLGMDYEPLFVDGRPINPHIIVREKDFSSLAGRIAEKYEKKIGIEMRIIQ